MNFKSMLKPLVTTGFFCAIAISLSACDNSDGNSQTDAAQTIPGSSTTVSNDTPATPASNPAPVNTIASTVTEEEPAAAPAPAPKSSPAPAPSAATASAGPFPRGQGLLWKPVSHGFGGRLVVLIPPSHAQPSTAIRVLDQAGNTIDQGNYHNAHGENGGRHHFVFSRTGSGYPSPSILSVGGANYLIPNPGARYE